MNRLALAALVSAALSVGGGSGYWFFVRPAQEEQLRLKGTVGARQAEKTELEAKIRRLEEARASQGMARVAYFDLRHAANVTREMEAKTVETLAGLTSIFQDQHLEIQTLVPEGVTQGLERPVPSVAPSTDPAATPGPSPTPTAPGATPTPPPVRLTHKVYRVVLRGEYGDLVKALREIQALPRAININQFVVKLVRLPEEKGDATAVVASPSMLELSFHLSISFVVAQAARAPEQSLASTGRAGSPLRAVLAWAWALVEQPAEAAEARPRVVQLAPTDEGTRHTGPDLVPGHVKPRPHRIARRAPHSPPRHRRSHRARPPGLVARRPQPVASQVPGSATPAPTPTPMAVPAEPSLQRPYVGTYAFPIMRAGEAGRQNPFRPVGLALRVEPSLAGAAPSGAAAPPAIPAPPSLPGAAGTGPAASSAKAAEGGIRLLGILAGGSGRPMALLDLGGRTWTVGINDSVSGNARVVSIRPDGVSLSINGREVSLGLTP